MSASAPGPRWPLLLEAQNPRRAGAGDDGDFVQRVFAVEVGERASAREPARVHVLSMSCAVGAVHQQADDLRIGQERAAVGMVGAHHHAPGVFDQQVPLQPDRPLQRMDERLVPVLDRRDAAAGFHFGVAAEPLAA